jgi:hypothetical protein
MPSQSQTSDWSIITKRDRDLALQFLNSPGSDEDRENLALIIATARQEAWAAAIEECAKAHELTAEKPGFDSEWHRKAAVLMRSVAVPPAGRGDA